MIGGIDKQVVAKGDDFLEREVRGKVGPLAKRGGYIPGFDHSVHPDVSLQTYKRYLKVLREEAEKV